MKKILIAYYSRKGNNYVGGSIIDLPVGNTEIAATKIQAILGGDLFEIQTVQSYSKDYHACTNEAKKELNGNFRPELSSQVEHMDDYDFVFLGFPNWWGTMPMCVVTFLESYNLKGKTILPFCTHEGGGMGGSERDIKEFCSESTITAGLPILGGSIGQSDKAIKQWLHEVGMLN